MSISEYLQQIRSLRSGIENLVSRQAEVLALDLLDSARTRIQTTGKKPSGKNLKPYSKRYLEFKKNPKAVAPKTARRLGLGSSRFTGKVDYTLTSRMWNNIAVRPVEIAQNVFKVSYGAQNDETNNKLLGLSKRDGFNPIEPSQNEIDEALQDFRVNFQATLNRFL